MTYVCPQVPHNFIPLSILYGIVLYHKPSNIDGNMRIFILETFFCLLNIRINQYENSNQKLHIQDNFTVRYGNICLVCIQEQILIETCKNRFTNMQ